MQAIVDEIRPLFDRLLEFVKLNFLINYNSSETVATEDSYENSLEKFFNQQCIYNNHIYMIISKETLKLVHNWHFHEAMVEIMTVASIATMFSRDVEDNEGHRGLAFSLYYYLCSQEEYRSRGRSILHSFDAIYDEDGERENTKIRFNLLKAVYYEARAQYPALLANGLEYGAFGQDEMEKQTFTCGQFAIDRWKGCLNNQMKKMWHMCTKNFDTDSWRTRSEIREASEYIKILMDKSYPELYKLHVELAEEQEWRECQ